MRDLKQGVTMGMYRYICEREQRHYQQCVMWAYVGAVASVPARARARATALSEDSGPETCDVVGASGGA